MDNLTPVGDILTDSLIESPEPSGPTAKGLKASTAGIKSAGGGLAALAGTALHSPTIRDYGLGAVDRANTEAGDNSMRIEDIKDFGGAMDFAKYGAGYLLPQVMLSVLAGGVGRGLGAAAGRTTENLATKAFLRSAGTTLGLAGSSVGQEVGSIYPEALQTGVANPETRALVGGAAAGALDVIPEVYLASRLNLFKNALSRPTQVAGPAGIARAAGAEALKTAAIEGSTEGAQTAIERASAGQPLTGAEANSDYLNSIALGVLGGGILGAPTGVVHAMRGPETAPDNLAPLPTQPSEPQAPSIEAPAPAIQVTPDATPLDVPEGAYARLDGAVGDSLPDLNQLPYRPGQVPTEPVDALTLSQQAAALQRADAEIAATPERLAVGVLETEKANLLARQETLQAEAQLPKDQRRPMSAIVQEQRTLAARLPDLDNQIKTQSLLADTPKYQPKGRLTEGQVLDQAPPPSPGVKLVGTPDFARTAEQVMSDRRAGSPIVLPEQAAPPAPEIILPEPSAGSGPRTRVTSDLNHPFAAPDPTPRPAASVPELPLETKYAAERAAASARTPQQFVNDAVNAVHAEATTMHYTLNKGTTKKLTAAIHAAATAPNPVEAFRDTFASTLASKAKSNPLRDLVEQVSAKLSGEVSEYNSKAAAETMSYLDISGKGREAIDYLRHILGTPGDLEVSLFEAPAGGPVGVARIGPFKSVIELAYNAKDVLSTAAHEGFHFLENKVLSKSEVAVVRRALAKGAPLRANLVQAVRAYDAENGTDILGQLGNQQEVNAYAYEFWKRGQFEARGILGKVFRKVKQILERVRNAIDGLGYTSIEDVFTAIDLGAYAARQEAPNAVKYAPTPGFKVPPQLSLFSKAAVADVVNRAAKGEVPYTQVMRETGNLLDSDELPDPTFKDVFGASRQAFGSSLSRWYLENVASGLEIARRSKGFANVFNVLTAYRQRKDRLISEGVDIQLSRWRNANGQDTAVVGKALLDRTVGAYTKDSPEYQAIRGKLTAEQRRMFDQAGLMISDRLGKEFLADQRSMKSILGADTPAYQEWFENRATQVQRLIDEGYVPERRYGDHIVNISIPVTGSDGRVRDVTLFNEQYESQAEATVRSKQYEALLAEAAPEMKVTYGYRYKAEHDASLSYQQFLDTARRQGVTLSQTERERLAKAMISSDSLRRNRIFRRKNVPGYSQDAMRVLSEFAVSMANKIAYSEFSSAIHDALEGMPVSTRMENGIPSITVEEGPDLWKADGPMGGAYRNITNERADFVMNPTEGNAVSSTLRAAASFNFLGGSLAAGMVQLSSLPMNTVPWLSQHAGYANAFGKTLAALKDTAANFSALTDPSKLEDGTVPIPAVDVVPGLREALTSAAQDGTTLDTEIYQIMGLTRGGLLSKSRGVQQAISTWMAPFRLTEQVNRISTFIAAYKVGAEKKLHGEALYKFAQDAVYNTQFRYDEVNRPGLAQSPWGSVLFTFKSYPLFMLETMGVLFRTKPSAATAMLLSMAVAAGVNGMPFAEDLMDLIDVVSQRLFGAPFNSRRALRNWFKQGSEAITGADLSGVLMNGVVNEATGLNFASRVGMGNLLPGTRLGAADADYANLMQEMLGPVGSLVTGWVKGVGSVTKGEFLTAVKQAAPLAAKNLVKGGEQFATGFASDLGGRKLADVSTWEAFAQSIGFSSAALSRAYDLDRIDKQDKAFYEQMRGEFTKQIVQGVREGNQDLVREAVDSITAWNQAYPAMQMAVTPSAVRRQIIEAGLPLNQRTLMALPRQLRGASMSLANNGVL